MIVKVIETLKQTTLFLYLLNTSINVMTEAKVNCFGLALAVVAGCQVLGFHDVHLAMSEDHAWVVYGHKGKSKLFGKDASL